MTPVVVTLFFRAPEIFLGDPNYSYPIDIWALGIFFHELIFKKVPFYGKNDADIMGNITKKLGWPDLENYPELEYL